MHHSVPVSSSSGRVLNWHLAHSFLGTGMIEPKRIEKLLVLLSLGFVWAHGIGEWKASIKPIPLKKLRNQKKPKNNFF